MAYTPTYTSGDLSPIAFDLVGTFMAGLTGEAGVMVQLIVLAIIMGLITGVIGSIFLLIKKFSSFGR